MELPWEGTGSTGIQEVTGKNMARGEMEKAVGHLWLCRQSSRAPAMLWPLVTHSVSPDLCISISCFSKSATRNAIRALHSYLCFHPAICSGL